LGCGKPHKAYLTKEIYVIFAAIIIFIAIWASYADLCTRRIPNYLTLSAMLLGLGLHAGESGIPGFLDSLGGLGLGFSVFLALYILGGMGAGDVKLMGGMGALLGLKLTAIALIYTALAGGIMAIIQILVNRAWKNTFFNLINIFIIRGKSTTACGEIASTKGNALSIPYGIAIGAGSILAVLLGRIY